MRLRTWRAWLRRRIARPQVSDPKALLRAHLVAEVQKLAVTVILFAAVLVLIYVLGMLTGGFVLALVRTSVRGARRG